MKNSPYPRMRTILGAITCALLAPALASAQSVWTGAGFPSDSFQQGDNWTGTELILEPNAQNHLQFGPSAEYTPDPDLGLSFSTITFAADAPQGYTFADTYGVVLQMSSAPSNTYIYNYSRHLVTIEGDMALYSARHSTGGYTTKLGNIVSQYGDILWSGNSVQTDAVILRKGGRKSLILTGDHSGYLDGEELKGGIEVLELHGGTLVMDINAGFQIREDVAIEFEGMTYHMNAHQDPGMLFGSGSTLHIVGKNDPSETTSLQLGSFRIGTHNSPMRTTHRIIVDSNGGMGTQLQFSSIDSGGTGYQTTSLNTLNVVLDASSSLQMPLPLVADRPTSYNVTVTTPGGLTGSITGLAAISGNNVVRNTSFTVLPDLVDGNVNNTTAYRLVGDALFSRTNSNNTHNLLLTLGTDTLGVGGSLTLTDSPAYQGIGIEALLMEEGTGDYHIGVSVTKGSRIIHQYSQHGTLYFDAGIDAEFVKTGPGTMVVSASAINAGTGSIHVQEGRLIINSDYAQVGNTAHSSGDLRKHGLFIGGTATGGGTLAGAGTIGDGSYSSGLWARIHIHRGGTLDGTAQHQDANNVKKALTVHGDLYFYHEESIYKVDLHADNGTPLHVLSNPNNASTTLVTLNGDLQLELFYAPQMHDLITLMTWETGFDKTGEFLTVNGEGFRDDNVFSLDFDGNPYDFQLHYGADSLYLQVIGTPIPEPATVATLLGMALAGIIWLRRRRA